ncbi:MAG: hypothetical protein ABIN80_13350 [Dyadobacter sp.]|uniref:hypothetical protein n=1 Tax=Dyadobacter sp. TaxID=1914288 RepID=UPI003267BBE6
MTLEIFAQTPDRYISQNPSKRVSIAPASVFKMFREAAMNPVNHDLTEFEKAKVKNAFSHLPVLHQKILSKHLHSISFMDNMPNTALTSPVESTDSVKMFNITFRAGILNETISQWATWKENTCYTRSGNADYEVRIEAGEMDAILYVLLHEATHVADAVLQITPPSFDKAAFVSPTLFTKDIWRQLTLPDPAFTDSLTEKTLFRSGNTVPIELATAIYKKLRDKPFASLYGMASWQEDLAELETIYHLTSKLKQPFCVTVRKNNVELIRFEPMKNVLVRKRLKQLEIFYKT